MTIPIPFLNFFKKVKEQAMAGKEPSAATRNPTKPVEKPSTDRFSKTVMPNATRSISPQESYGMPPRSSGGQIGGSVIAHSAPRTIAVGATAHAARPSDLPPAVALAL